MQWREGERDKESKHELTSWHRGLCPTRHIGKHGPTPFLSQDEMLKQANRSLSVNTHKQLLTAASRVFFAARASFLAGLARVAASVCTAVGVQKRARVLGWEAAAEQQPITGSAAHRSATVG